MIGVVKALSSGQPRRKRCSTALRGRPACLMAAPTSRSNRVPIMPNFTEFTMAGQAKFDMPSGMGVTFETRGGWVVNALSREYGLTLNQAAGIVGNAGYESAGFKILQEIKPLIAGSRGGTGWCQWTASRRLDFEAWCRARSLKVSSDEANYGFLCHEMDGTHSYCLGPLRREVSVEQCVLVWGRDYEAPAGTTHDHLPAFDDRLKYARRALAGASGSTVSPTGSSPRTPSHRKADPDHSANDLNRAELERIKGRR